jgi:Protein of unknown function (DUF2842)
VAGSDKSHLPEQSCRPDRRSEVAVEAEAAVAVGRAARLELAIHPRRFASQVAVALSRKRKVRPSLRKEALSVSCRLLSSVSTRQRSRCGNVPRNRDELNNVICDSPGGRANRAAPVRLRVKPISRYGAPVTEPSVRKLIGIAVIAAIIVVWATFIASLAPFVGKWPVLAQAPYYLLVGVAWVIPLKPLIRWAQTGSFRSRPRD